MLIRRHYFVNKPVIIINVTIYRCTRESWFGFSLGWGVKLYFLNYSYSLCCIVSVGH